MRITAACKEGGLIADHHHEYRKCHSGHKVAPLGHTESRKYLDDHYVKFATCFIAMLANIMCRQSATGLHMTHWDLTQMRRFEKVGLTRAQAEQVTELLTETICMNKVKITEQFVSKAALEKVCLMLLPTAQLLALVAAFQSLVLNVSP